MKEVKFKKFIYLLFFFFSYLQNFAVDANAIFNVRINKLKNKNFFLTTTGFESLTLDTTIERANHFYAHLRENLNDYLE